MTVAISQALDHSSEAVLNGKRGYFDAVEIIADNVTMNRTM
jgi:hypothetical protein